jgi:dTMP kinase
MGEGGGAAGAWIAFEGIDGGGKTTLSNLVCDRLRQAGRDVVHAREKGVLGSAVARRVRELTRDARLLEMSPRAELLLNLAREAQQLDEVIRPALAHGAMCVSDRSLHSIIALAVAGRGLPRAEVEPAAVAASPGRWPDVVVVVDVEPELARLRKRVGKILEGRTADAESRKGLAGAGLQARIRRHLLAEAERDPARWIVVRNEGGALGDLVDALVDELLGRAAGGPPVRRRVGGATRRFVGAPEPGPAALAARFYAEVDAVAAREPGLAAQLLAGIPGPLAHERRAALAPRAPAVVARALHGLGDPGSFALRRVLAADVPADVAAGLADVTGPEVHRVREALLSRAPAAVAAALAGDGSPEAWALREAAVQRGARAAVLAGLAGVDGPRAWALRAEGLAAEQWDGVGRSLAGLSGARADAARAEVAARDRLAALRGTSGVDGPAARALCEALFPHAAKRVLRAVTGLDADWAWALRARAAGLTREALDSIEGLDGARAWALRESFVEAWPAAALSSLGLLAATPRGRALVNRALAAAPDGLVVLRNAHAALARAGVGAPAPGPTRLEEERCTTC